MCISANWSFTLQMWNCMKLKLAKTQTTICNLFTSHRISHELLVQARFQNVVFRPNC